MLRGLRCAAIALGVPLLSGAGPAPPDSTPVDARLAIESRLLLAGCDAELSLSLPPSGSVLRQTGRVVGTIEGMQAFGDYCTGYFVEEAFACFRVPAGGARVELEIIDGGGADTTLAIWDRSDWLRCDDDGGSGLLSRLDVSLDAGVYYVYVGTFSRQVTSAFEVELRRP